MSWELLPDAPEPERSPFGRSAGENAYSRVNRGSGAPRWVLLAVGVLVALVGVALLIWPFFAGSQILAFLVGVALIGNGLAAFVGSRARGIGVPTGVLLLVLGAIAMIFPKFTASLLVSFVAVMMLMFGGIWLLIALGVRNSVGWPFVVAPAVIVVLGIVALTWPAAALTIAALAIGALTLLIGISLVWAALALRRRSE